MPSGCRTSIVPVRDVFRISVDRASRRCHRTQAVSVSYPSGISISRVTTRQEASFEYVTVFAVIDCQGAQLTLPIVAGTFPSHAPGFVHCVAPVFLL